MRLRTLRGLASAFFQPLIALMAYFAIVFLSLSDARSSAPLIDQKVLEILRSQARPSWRMALEEIHRGGFDIQGVTRKEIGQLADGDDKVTKSGTVQFDACMKLAQSCYRLQRRSMKGPTQVSGANERYSFEVLAQPEEPFVLKKVVGGSADEPTILPEHREYRWYFCAGYCAWRGVPIDEFLFGDGFEIIGAANDDAGKIRAEARSRGGAKGPLERGTFWVVIDPARRWLVEKCGVELPGEASLSLTADYAKPSDTFPSLITFSRKSTDPKSPYFDRTVVEITSVSGCRHENDEFYLPYYGISENALDAFKEPPAVRWLAGGLSGLVVAAVLWFASRKLRAMRAP